MPSVGLPAAAGPTRGMISGSVFRRPTRDRSWRDDMTDAPNPVPLLTFRQKLVLTFRRRWSGSGFWYGLAITLLWPFAIFGTKLGWRGAEHLPKTGGVLLAINHVSSADPIYDVAFVICNGRMPRFLAKSELWDMPGVRNVLGGGRHVPV